MKQSKNFFIKTDEQKEIVEKELENFVPKKMLHTALSAIKGGGGPYNTFCKVYAQSTGIGNYGPKL